MADSKETLEPPHSETLIVRRRIRASPDRLFDAWTNAEHLEQWWGPPGVDCPNAEIDLRVGGRYRIANLLPDGTTIWIEGVFETLDRPHRIVYSWRSSPKQARDERVDVRFEWTGNETEVTVTHERIANTRLRDDHRRGWDGCLLGLDAFTRAHGSPGSQ